MNKLERIFKSRYLIVAIILLNIVLPLLVFATLSPQHIKMYFSSDTLYLASIYKDIFIDGTGFKGWNLNGAPNFFPDMLLYFMVRPFFSDFKVAYVAFSVIQFNIIAYLLGALLRTINKNIPIVFVFFFYFLFPVFLLASLWHGSFQYTFHIFSQSYHNGGFINALVVLNLFLLYLNSHRAKLLIPIFLITFLGAFNDRLFIVILAFPIFLIWIVNFFRIRSKTVRWGGLIVLISTILGVIVFDATKWNNVYHCIALGDKFMNFENFIPSLNIFLRQHIDFLIRYDLRGLILILMLVSLVLFAIYLIKVMIKSKWLKHNSELNTVELVFVVFSFVSVLVTLFTPVINGYYVGYACIRYVTFAYFISILNFVFALYLFKVNQKLIYGVNLLLLFALLMTILNITTGKSVLEGMRNVVNYYPEKVKKLDEYAEKSDIKYGLAYYWDAKLMTMFSKQDLRVYTITSSQLTLWFHVMNSNWYFDYDKGKYNKPRFNFVVSEPKKFMDTRRITGEPFDSTALINGDYVYLIDTIVYDRETKKPHLLKNE